MASPKIQTKKKEKFLIFVLTLLILVFLMVIWQEFFKKPKEALPPLVEVPQVRFKEIEIDLKILDDLFFQALLPYQEVSLPEKEIGRENPFLLLK